MAYSAGILGGVIVTILLGVAGGLLGGFIGREAGLYREGESVGIFMAILGAVALLAIYRVMVRPRSRII